MGISMFYAESDAGLFRPVSASTQERKEPARVDVPVVIIGGGPAGLLQAHLLSQLGGKYTRFCQIEPFTNGIK